MESSINCEIVKDLVGSHLVYININEKKFSITVEDCFLTNGTSTKGSLKVFVLDALSDQVLIQLPSQEYSRLWIPKELLEIN